MYDPQGQRIDSLTVTVIKLLKRQSVSTGNALREAFGLPGVPIRLTVREKANPYAGRGKR